jgi:hypothetical protein
MRSCLLFLLLLALGGAAAAQPVPLRPGLSVRHVLTAAPGAVRLVHDPLT